MPEHDPPIQTMYAHDRLTTICDAMAETFHTHPDATKEDQAIILLSDGRARYGAAFINYSDMSEAMVDLLAHMKATFEANGKAIAFASIPLDPEGDEEDGPASPS